jgi:hypothetical protein
MLDAIKNFRLPYETGRTWVEENQRLTFSLLGAIAAFSALALLYRRLHQPDILPFDRWHVSLGLTARKELTSEEIKIFESKNWKSLVDRYPPTELASRLFAYLQTKNSLKNPKTQTAAPTSPLLSKHAYFTLPSYRESSLLFLEEEKALTLQTWATSLQQWVTLLGLQTAMFKENIFQAIQSSPHLGFTILFNFAAPYAAQQILVGIQKALPLTVYEKGNQILEHKGKIAFACLTAIAALYYIMRQEKGILTNLTENWIALHGAHKGLDFITSYQKGIHEIFNSVGKSLPGAPGSNVIWYYNPESHSSFPEEIGESLAEITASGRVYNSDRLATDFPHLKDLKIFKLDLEAFLIAYRDVNAIHQGWNETMNYISRSGNVLVVFEGLSKIHQHLLPFKPRQQGEGPAEFNSSREMSTEKVLASLVTLSLKRGRFRCLMTLSSREKRDLQQNKELFRLFTAIQAPDIQPEEIEKYCLRRYSSSDASYSLPRADIQDLFTRLKPSLAKIPCPPHEITSAIEETLKTRELSWRKFPNEEFKGKKEVHTKNIEKSERHLQEAQRLKEQLLQKLWLKRRFEQPEPLALHQGVYLLEHILLPMYGKIVFDLKREVQLPTSQQELLTTVQRHFKKFFGHCSETEEKRLEELPGKLKKVIQGQEDAIDAIYKTIALHRRVPPLDGKPLVIILAGPSASGKSQTATLIAQHLKYVYGISDTSSSSDESNVMRINLNRKQQGGFSGFDKTKAEINSHLLETPTTVVICEEFDKIDSSEKSSFLELFEGTPVYFQGPWSYSSENGPLVDTSCGAYILTANIQGAPEISMDNPPPPIAQDAQSIKKGILASFPGCGPAYLSRLDAVIPFIGIDPEASIKLGDIYLDKYIELEVLPQKLRVQAKGNMLKRSTPEERKDGRQLQRIVREAIYDTLVDEAMRPKPLPVIPFLPLSDTLGSD